MAMPRLTPEFREFLRLLHSVTDNADVDELRRIHERKEEL